MHTVEIPHEGWSKSLNEFSLMHEGWLISVDVLASAIGAQPEIHELPLVGVVAEAPEKGGTITISAASSSVDQITHTIHSPTRVWLERTEEGADAALAIESAPGTTTILRFRTPALPETVDGVVMPS